MSEPKPTYSISIGGKEIEPDIIMPLGGSDEDYVPVDPPIHMRAPVTVKQWTEMQALVMRLQDQIERDQEVIRRQTEALMTSTAVILQAITFGQYAKSARQNNRRAYMQGFWPLFRAFEEAADAWAAKNGVKI